MRELHLFAGGGGGILGGLLLGHTPVCAVEIEPYCRRILLQRQRDGVLPRFPVWDDVRTFDGRPWRGRVDVVCGGFPCQRFSSAAHGKNTAEDLWPEMLRITQEAEPAFVFAENVTAAAIEIAAEDLEALGYSAKAVPFAASDLGGDHIRRRYWILGYADQDGESGRSINVKTQMLSRVCDGVWLRPPDRFRVDDGVASRLDRLAATGNGQVPAVASLAWRVLLRRIAEGE